MGWILQPWVCTGGRGVGPWAKRKPELARQDGLCRWGWRGQGEGRAGAATVSSRWEHSRTALQSTPRYQ